MGGFSRLLGSCGSGYRKVGRPPDAPVGFRYRHGNPAVRHQMRTADPFGNVKALSGIPVSDERAEMDRSYL